MVRDPNLSTDEDDEDEIVPSLAEEQRPKGGKEKNVPKELAEEQILPDARREENFPIVWGDEKSLCGIPRDEDPLAGLVEEQSLYNTPREEDALAALAEEHRISDIPREENAPVALVEDHSWSGTPREENTPVALVEEQSWSDTSREKKPVSGLFETGKSQREKALSLLIRKRMGEILIELGLITREQYGQAYINHIESGKVFEKTLVEMKFCTEEQIAQALGNYCKIPFIEVDQIQIPFSLLNLIPEVIIRSHKILPVFKNEGTLTLAMVDPFDAFIVEEIKFQTSLEIQKGIVTETAMLIAIQRYFGAELAPSNIKVMQLEHLAEDFSKKKEEGSSSPAQVTEFDLMVNDDAAVVNYVSRLLLQAINEKASDIHFDPEENHLRIRFRIDGVLTEITRIPKLNQPEIIARIKLMSDMDITDKRLPQDGRIKARIAEKNIDLRASLIPVVWGEKIVLRILDRGALNLSLKDVGFDDNLLGRFESAIKQPNGIILLNGPTGSGKTSTLYAAINFVASPKVNIVTVEDPVEIHLPGAYQVQVKSDIGLTFSKAITAFMRQDPNVIMIGEIRDVETAQIAIEAALTGQLVFSTLHTNDAPSTIDRLVDLKVEPFLISTSLIAAVAQRLVRKICPKCRQKYEPTNTEIADLQLYRVKFQMPEKPEFFIGAGCQFCLSRGLKGRTAIHEMLVLDDSIRRLINAKGSTIEIRNIAREKGMKTLRENGISKALNGITTISEVLRTTKKEDI